MSLPSSPVPRLLFLLATAASLLVASSSSGGTAPFSPGRCTMILPAARSRLAGLAGLNRLAPDPEATRSIGLQKILYLRVRFADDPEDPVPAEEAAANLAEADTYLRRMSYGLYGLIPTVSPVIPLPSPRDHYDSDPGFNFLIDDSRAAAAAAGFDYRDYDLDVVRHYPIPSFSGGTARVGTRGIQLQVGGSLVLIHEIGHNLGLLHANFWDTSGAGIANASPPLPSNYASLPDPRSLPYHPDSVVGHETIIGPGQSVEYGDVWDIMGVGDADFGAAFKETLGWLPGAAVAHPATGFTSYRLFALDALDRTNPRLAFLRLPGPFLTPAGPRDYGIELPSTRSGLPPAPGVVVRWLDRNPRPPGPSLVLDSTPGSPDNNADAILPVGRTFSDPTLGLHVTPTLAGTNVDGARWVDVTVARGRFRDNQPPDLRLLGPTTASPGQSTSFQAAAIDPDGDSLAYYWDFGDDTPTTNTSSPDHVWLRTGDYLVRVEVTDRRGGTTSAQTAVKVGQAPTVRISGTVRTPSGQPVAGVRVHNGRGSGERPKDVLFQTWTDSTGTYTLTGLPPGRQPLAAFHPDYLLERRPAVDVSTSDLTGIDFVASPIPKVTVTAPASVAESAGFTNLFTLQRSGPTDLPLTVVYQLGGTAQAGEDYARPLVDSVTFAPGASSVPLPLVLADNPTANLPRSIVFAIAHPTQASRTNALGQLFTVYYPGFEAVDWNGTRAWSRTHPEYRPDAGSQVTVALLDDDSPSLPVALGLLALGDDELQLRVTGPLGTELTLETSSDLVDWVPLRTVSLIEAETAVVLLPSLPGTHFFRTTGP